MAEEKELKQAQAVFKTLCDMLDEHEWKYEKDAESLSVRCGAQGEDLPIALRIRVDIKRQLVVMLSQMPFVVPENRRTALAVAVSQANDGMIDGSFDYDYTDGGIVFRMTSSYRESLIGKDLFEYMFMCTFCTVDKYNDKFFVVCKNEMSNEEILDFIQ